MHISIRAGLAALSLSLLACGSAAAQTVTIVVGYSAGASYDIYMRNFARHLGKHLPGKPNVVPQNMTGAGSLRSANFIYNQAPKDGTTLGMFARGLAMQPLLDITGIQYEALKFSWIGSMSSDVSLVLSWHTRPFKSIDDVRKSEMVVAGTGSGADSVIFPYILNGVLGTKFKVVTGYPGAADFLLGGRAPGSRRHRRRVVERAQRREARMDREQADQCDRPARAEEASRHGLSAAGDGVRQE